MHVPASIAHSSSCPSGQSLTPIAVHYRDGLTLTYLFERSATMADIKAAIARAGQILKVVLWDELPTGSTRKALP